ncbi:DENN domain-containing protein 2B isoform X2 [Helicoverpa armigera]
MERKLSKDRLKRLGNFLEDQMRKENFVPQSQSTFVPQSEFVEIVGQVREVDGQFDSIPDSEVPQHILDQYATIVKPKRKENEKQEAMTDSGVSSETENVEEDKNGRIKRLMSQFEKSPEKTHLTNLQAMDQFCDSSETIRLERKNPHLKLTDTLKKALKQPLPAGPPPAKPPRIFKAPTIPENTEQQKKEAKRMLEKLEKVLQKREGTVDTPKKPKEIHYLCTEILDITNRTLLPNQTSDPISRCINSLNCAITNNSTSSLPYTRLKSDEEKPCGACKTETTEPQPDVCCKCKNNEDKDGFKCHLQCECGVKTSTFYVENAEHIYDVPCDDDKPVRVNPYGTLNVVTSKSLEDLRTKTEEDPKIYDIPYEPRAPTPEIQLSSPHTPTSSPHTPNLSPHTPTPSPQTPILPPYTPTPSPQTPILPPHTPTPSPQTPILPPHTPNLSPQNTNLSPQTPTLSPETPLLTTETEMANKTEFEKLRQNFETGFTNPEQKKPVPIKPKPILISKLKNAKSIENLNGDYVRNPGKYHTDQKRLRPKKNETAISFTLPKRDTQLDLDRENLNDLMNELFETVTAVCNMEDNKPGSFPTEHSDGSTSEESVKLTRSLTEKRKNYVRRVSTRVAYLDPKNIKRFRHQTSVCSYKSEVIDNPYSTFRSWKSFRTSQGNIAKMDTGSKFNLTDSHGNVLSMKDVLDASSDSIDNMSIDEKAGCIDLPFEPRERGLFNLCLLVGLNHMTGQAYVKSVFPSQVKVPPHIENLVFPETMSSSPRSEWSVDAKSLQCYSLVLTDERGERAYGYCRRVLPEGATTCLPLCYCLIGRYRAPGFYYKVLEEIESHHGSSDVEIHSLLQQLFETDFPNPGEEITVHYSKNHDYDTPSNDYELTGDYCIPGDYNNVSPKSKTLPDMRREDKSASETVIPDYYDLENNNGVKNVTVSLVPRQKIIKRPIEPRVDEDNLSVLLDLLGAGLVIKVFGSLLLERKVIIIGDKLGSVSSCVEALQSSLYPFVWQQPLISMIPREIQREVLDAPLPILAGMLHPPHEPPHQPRGEEEGMLIDLTHPSKVLFYQGDESTILPTSCYKTLKNALQMETSKNKDRSEDTKTRNVMISEAFLRFFVDILGDFWKFFTVGEVKDGELGKGGVLFDKEAFIKNASSKQNQYFLEWFTETAMFTHFIQNMAASYHHHQSPETPQSPPELVDTPLPNFYELFEERVRSRTKTANRNVDSSKNNYKNAVNKKVRYLKSKLRDLVA